MTTREEPVVLWRVEDGMLAVVTWVEGTPHRPHPNESQRCERYSAYPAAHDPVPALTAQLAALRAEMDEAVKAERERIARKFDAEVDHLTALLKTEQNIGKIHEWRGALDMWKTCAAMAREEPK